MYLSRQWLAQFMDLRHITNSQITEALNSLGFEVDKTKDWGPLNDELIIGEVKTSSPIPETHLSLNLVDLGKPQLAQIICGAPNIKSGQLVIVAQPGQQIANGLLLTNRKIREFESQGMVCALNEIGFDKNLLTAEENDSIYEIKPFKKALIGKSYHELGFQDYIWDIDLTLNRSDALAAFQLAKELANYFHLAFNKRSKITKNTQGLIPPMIGLDNSIDHLVQTIATETIKIEPSFHQLDALDDLLMKRLGIKTTTNFYEDLANLNAWETGQALIVFDADKINFHLTLGYRLVGERQLVALSDGEEIVNVIGERIRSDYQVDSNTKTLGVVSLAITSPTMRNQQKWLNQNNIALQRLMKPLNPNLYEEAFANFNWWLSRYDLIRATSPINIVKQKIEKQQEYVLSLDKIKSSLGLDLTFGELQKLFKGLDFKVKSLKDKKIMVVPDSHRVDLYGVNDILEEIARLYGYDHIPAIPIEMTPQISAPNLREALIGQTQNYLLGQGMMNVKTYALVNANEADTWNLFDVKKPLALMAPLSQNHEIYRSSLVPSLIRVAQFNAANGLSRIKIWETAKLYSGVGQASQHLGILTSGPIFEEPLTETKLDNNFYYLKGIATTIFNLFQIPQEKINWSIGSLDTFSEIHPFLQAQVMIEDSLVGYLFRLNPHYEQQKKMMATFVFEIDLDVLWNYSRKQITLKPLSKFQKSSRDLAFVITNDQSFATIIAKLTNEVPHLINWKIVDTYQDEALAKRQAQALTISFDFNHLDRQLTEAEISQSWQKILSRAEHEGLEIR